MSVKKAVTTPKAPAAIGPYSQGVEAGGWVFVSGQIPADPATGTLAGPGVREQTQRALANLAAVLEAAGCGLSEVVKTTVYMTDLSRFAEMNEAYGRAFEASGAPPPARATVGVAALPKGAGVEIEAVALKKS